MTLTPRVPPGWLILLVAYVLARVVTALVLVITDRRRPDPQWPLFSPWDGGYYAGIAARGYPETVPTQPLVGDPSIAFFPGFPLLLRGVAEVFRTPILETGIVLNLIIGAVAVVVGYRLAMRYLDERVAFRATLLFISLPGAVVFSFLYADGLLILLCILTLLFLTDHRWLLAGLTGALATATRANALGLVVAAVAASVIAIRTRRQWSSLLAPAVMPLGILGYFLFLWVHTGDRLAWFHVQRDVWGQKIDFGRGFLGPLKHPYLWQSWDWWLAESGLLLLAIALWSAYRLWLPDKTWPIAVVPLVYTVAVLAQMLLYSSVGMRPRFVLVAFPLCWVIAQHWRPRYLYALAAGLALLAVPLVYLYATKAAVP